MQAKKARLLYGIENHHDALWRIVQLNYRGAGGKEERRIVLNQNEQQVARAGRGQALIFDRNGTSQIMTPQQFSAEAERRGFNREVAQDSLTMANSMNGVVGMACTNDDLVLVLNNLVSHMKARANENSDDLEIALAIDYSGSMRDNIEAVIKDLSVFAASLANVRDAGRRVRVGLTTFGKPGEEKMELNLTTDIAEVQANLTRLLTEFASKQHYIEPGEASYYGLLKTAELSWSSQNRQTIVVTDEPSYSLQRGDTAFVNSVIQRMSAISVYPLMVKLCN